MPKSRTGEPVVAYSCPGCGQRMDVKDSRPSEIEGVQTIRRRRQCRGCGTRVTTYEMVDIGDLLRRLRAVVREAHHANKMLSAVLALADEESEQATKWAPPNSSPGPILSRSCSPCRSRRARIASG